MNNLEIKTSVEKNKENKKSIAEQLEGLQNTLNAREEQSQLAKEGFGVNLEKVKYLAGIDEVANMIGKQNKLDSFQTLAYNKLGIA